jgi:hypothetical protein
VVAAGEEGVPLVRVQPDSPTERAFETAVAPLLALTERRAGGCQLATSCGSGVKTGVS